ncbi:hypothetical protein N0V93_006862 [Gnomoniopsis smithogilvyi]|uniref:Zn(2)-C6 fungal-type domain-containing protein n=1 Tax=Gnomoniopsis smithogilvyi TaxID=1191159 RepID=A0A9W8YQN1_9PEZI|nr:hypothetical protein N0V93_006862 [Gnomoniopsis smithogilvyi]
MQSSDQDTPEMCTSMEKNSNVAEFPNPQKSPTSASTARRREKPQLSCNSCRKRKVRCDRLQPCNTCASRGLGQSCVYSIKAPSARSQGRGHLQDRINQLENTIVGIIKGNSSNANALLPSPGKLASPTQSVSPHQTDRQESSLDSSSPRETSHKGFEDQLSFKKDAATSENGCIKIRESEVTYASNAHWAAVLDSIAELRNELNEDDNAASEADGSVQSHDTPRPRLFYGGDPQAFDLVSILECLPPRIVVDRSVARFFNTLDTTAGIIHSGKFLREYDDFWRTPSSAQPVWVGILFAILCLSAQFQQFYNSTDNRFSCEGRSPRLVEEPESEALINLYQQKTVQCLILSRYTKGGPYVLEALVLYTMTELFTSKEIDTGMRLLVATIFQIGVNMGCHRDGSHFPNISPFEGEMRRRIWSLIIQMDLGISKLVGLPRVVRHDQTDVAEPLNLFDSDFDEDSVQLPPSRPETEFTPSLYTRVRLRLARSVGIRVTDIATQPRPLPYSDILTIHNQVDSARNDIPLSLKWRGLSCSLNVVSRMLIKQIFLETTCFSMKILLHKRYMVASRSQPKYEFSRSVCVGSAIEILKLQHLVDDETQVEGRLYQARWSIITTFLHDFLLATGVLCFHLQVYGRDDHHTKNGSVQNPVSNVAELEKIKDILRATLAIWIRESGTSREARTAASAIRYVLSNCDSQVLADQSLADMGSGFLSQVEKGANMGEFFGLMPSNYELPGFTLDDAPESIGFSWENLHFDSNDLETTTVVESSSNMDTS